MNPDDLDDSHITPIPEPPPGLTDYELQLYRHAQDVQRMYFMATEVLRRWQAGDEPSYQAQRELFNALYDFRQHAVRMIEEFAPGAQDYERERAGS